MKNKMIDNNIDELFKRSRVNKRTKSILSKGLQGRKRYLWKNQWIPHPQAMIIHKQLLDVICYYSNDNSMSVIGPSGIGKTKLFEAFTLFHSSDIRELLNLPPDVNPILHTEFTSRGGHRSLFIRLLTDLGDPQPAKGTTEEMQVRVIRHLRQQQIKVVFLDDIHRLLDGGRSQSVQNGLRNSLRELSDRSGLKIILIGTELARQVIEADSQTARIFRCTFELRPWSMNKEKDKTLFMKFLGDLEASLPLRVDSYIEENEKICRYILEQTKGITSEIVQLVKVTAEQLMEDAKYPEDEKITLSVLKKARYVPPPAISSKKA